MRVLIIEDEARIARRIERITKEILGDRVQSIFVCETLIEGTRYIKQHTIDILLLDLNLNGEDGFSVLKTMVAEPFHTIVISAYTEKAITAFEYGVLDFVPKPFDKSRLLQAFERGASRQKADDRTARFLAIKKGHRISFVDVQDVIYIKGAGIYTELHLTNGEKEIHDKSLTALEQLLPRYFHRIHKSYLVDVRRTLNILVQPGGQYNLVLSSGEILPIGRTKYPALKQVMGSS